MSLIKWLFFLTATETEMQTYDFRIRYKKKILEKLVRGAKLKYNFNPSMPTDQVRFFRAKTLFTRPRANVEISRWYANPAMPNSRIMWKFSSQLLAKFVNK